MSGRSSSGAANGDGGRLFGLPPDQIRPSEVVLHHWRAPDGRALLTNQRCLLLGRPRPFRRELAWSQELDAVRGLNVEKVVVGTQSRISFRPVATYGGGTAPGRIDATYSVTVNGVPVFIGDPNDAAEIQRRIDDARAARCLELHGKVLPFLGTDSEPPP